MSEEPLKLTGDGWVATLDESTGSWSCPEEPLLADELNLLQSGKDLAAAELRAAYSQGGFSWLAVWAESHGAAISPEPADDGEFHVY